MSLGLLSVEVQTYLDTASRDPGSPLNRGVQEEMVANLVRQATSAGMLGAKEAAVVGGMAEDDDEEGIGRNVGLKVRTGVLCTPEEQTAVVTEVGHVCEVMFEPRVDGVYTSHAVGRVVSQSSERYLFSMVTTGATVLEVGATLLSIVHRAPDPGLYKAAVPVLGLRDNARASVEGRLRTVVCNKNGRYSKKQERTARALLEDPRLYYEQKKVQDFTSNSEFIVSNMANFDIDMDEIPSIMSKHGSRVWLGSLVRVKGLNRVLTKTKGEVMVTGARYEVDPAEDVIRFHFRGGADLEYVHKFSSFVKYEERNDYKWMGPQWDYVYSKLAATTESTLYFSVHRVPHCDGVAPMPVFATTGKGGLARVRAFRMEPCPVSGFRPVPFEFDVERLAYDKALERRRALGGRGNIVFTLSILRSMRVRMYVNGVPIGIEHRLMPDTLDSLAMVVELAASDARRRSERDYRDLMHLAGDVGPLVRFMDVLGCAATKYLGREVLRGMLKKVLFSGDRSGIVGVDPYPEYVRVDQGMGTAGQVELEGAACSCREAMLVAAALALGEPTYTVIELEEMQIYLDELQMTLQAGGCGCGFESVKVDPVEEDLPDEFFECNSGDEKEEEVEEVSSPLENTACDGERVMEVHPDPASRLALATEEYATVVSEVARRVRCEAVEEAKLMAMRGWPPSKQALERSATVRVQHYAVKVIGGRLAAIDGPNPPASFAELYSLRDERFYRVSHGKLGESVTEVMYANSFMEVMNGDELARSARQSLRDDGASWMSSRFRFCNAVPGAGKTHTIKEVARACRAAGRPALCLAATVASTTDILENVWGDDLETGKCYVRTLDSALMHRARQKVLEGVEEVLVDEAPMAHIGEILAVVIRYSRARVRLWGDVKQIPYVSFLGGFKPLYASLLAFSDCEKMDKSHRLAVDARAAQIDEYDGNLFGCECHACTKCEDTISMRRIGGVHEIVHDPEARYLVFKQDERSLLLAHFGVTADVKTVRKRKKGGMATVHEEQGSTRKKVILVRLEKGYDAKPNARAPSLYNKRPYVLSAMTRHTESFTYLTASAEVDLVTKCVEASRCPFRRAAAKGEVKWEDVRGMAYDLPFNYEKVDLEIF